MRVIGDKYNLVLTYRTLDRTTKTRTIRFFNATGGVAASLEDLRRISVVNDRSGVGQDISTSTTYRSIAANGTTSERETTVLVRFLKIQDYLGLYTGTNYTGPDTRYVDNPNLIALYSGVWPSDLSGTLSIPPIPAITAIPGPPRPRMGSDDFKTRERAVIATERRN